MCSRPGISTALSILRFSQANPSVQHFHAMKKVLRYFRRNISMRLTLEGVGEDDHSLQLSGYANADRDNDATPQKP
jgi:hypothetical protein